MWPSATDLVTSTATVGCADFNKRKKKKQQKKQKYMKKKHINKRKIYRERKITT